jgi:hypothetical protein
VPLDIANWRSPNLIGRSTIADEAERDVLCTVDSTNLGFTLREAQRVPIQSRQAT